MYSFPASNCMQTVWLQTLKYLKIGTCPAAQTLLAYMEKNGNLSWKSSKVSLGLQPEALVNMSGRVDFSSPGAV